MVFGSRPCRFRTAGSSEASKLPDTADFSVVSCGVSWENARFAPSAPSLTAIIAPARAKPAATASGKAPAAVAIAPTAAGSTFSTDAAEAAVAARPITPRAALPTPAAKSPSALLRFFASSCRDFISALATAAAATRP